MDICSTSQLSGSHLGILGEDEDAANWGRHGFDGIDCGLGGMSGCGHL
jgi:hypothetical protein